MKNKSHILLLFLLSGALFAGCTHKHVIIPTAPANYESLNERGLQQQAIVILVNGRKQTTHKLRFAPDSTSWVDPDTQNVITVQTEEVSSIKFVSTGKGALEGMGIGLLSGAPAGTFAGIFTGGEGDLEYSPGEMAFAGAIFVGGTGGLVGLLIGAAVGSEDIYYPY